MKRLLLVLTLLLGLTSAATAQTSITTTTLTNAITTLATNQNIVVAAITGMVPNSTFLYIDGSIYRISATTGTTGVTIQNQYFPATHLATSTVYVVPLGAQIGINPVGSCIRGGTAVFPAGSPYTLMFNTQNGNVARCAGTLGSRRWIITNPYSVGAGSNDPPQTP